MQGGDDMNCVERCEFQKFAEGKFYCTLYDGIILDAEKPLSVEDSEKIIIHRCEKCTEEELIGSNTTLEDIRKVKQYLGLMGDGFYSFKDDFEECLTNMYRILKEMEDDIKDEVEENEG